MEKRTDRKKATGNLENEPADEKDGVGTADESVSSKGLSDSCSEKSLKPLEPPLIDVPASESHQEERHRVPLNKRLTLIPEALPIFSMATQHMAEPEMKYKINRMLGNRRITMDVTSTGLGSLALKRQNCKHLRLKDYACLECQQVLPSFKGSIFDTGGITTYLNIKYVNEYLDEFESNHNVGQIKAKLVYENYKPKNVHEMREYMLYTIDKSIKKAIKYGQITREQVQILGQPGCGKNLSPQLMSYIYIKKHREQSVLCQEPDSRVNEKNQQNSMGQQQPQAETMDADTNQPYTGIGPHCLLFDSFFESGNLERAEYVTPTEYNLYLNVDTNTKGHQQWFYFKVKNTFKGKKYTLNIRNFTKPFSLHRQGMKILMKSKKSRTQENKEDLHEGWVPIGDDMNYWRTDIQRSGWRVPGPLNLDDEEDDDQILDDINGVDGSAVLGLNSKKGMASARLKQPFRQQNTLQNVKKRRRYFYCLTFKVTFEYDDDVVYFAYSTPYTYSRTFIQMLNNESNLIKQQKQSKELSQDLKVTDSEDKTGRQIVTREIVYERKLLAKSISGLPIPIITITARRHRGLAFKKRQGICISARVHPGETNSNFVFDGIIRYLLSNDGIYNLLHNYVFKLIPSLNPDGNVCGNYRSSLAGVDLNRQWVIPNKDIHPIVFKAKEMLAQFSKERQLLVYCDLHCHSKKMNSFIYGCNTAANGGFTSWTKTRLLPRILAGQTALFNIKDCKFRVDPDKLGTARVIIWKEFGVTNSFTLENSFFGSHIGQQILPFSPKNYLDIGESLMRALVEYRICIKQIENELIETKGWLKPKLLLEVTGTPAAQKIAEEQEAKLKKEQKQKKIEQYKQSLGLHIDESKEPSPAKGKGKQQQKYEKTRNVQRTNTLGQQVSPMTGNNSSTDVIKQIPLKKQNSNLSDSKIGPGKTVQGENRQSSSDSTNDLSLRKLTMTVQSGQDQGTPKSQVQKNASQKFQRDYRILNGKKVLSAVRVSNIANGKLKKQESFSSLNNSQNGGKYSKFRRQDSASSSNQIAKNDTTSDWRAYFQGEELEEIFEQIEEGDDPNDEEDNLSLSDDNASDDNLDMQELYKEVYMRGSIMENEIEDIKQAENICKRDLENQIQETRLQAQSRKKKRTQNLKEQEEILQKLHRIESNNSLKNLETNDNNFVPAPTPSCNDLLFKTQDPSQDTALLDDDLNRTHVHKISTLPLTYPHITPAIKGDISTPSQSERRFGSQQLGIQDGNQFHTTINNDDIMFHDDNSMRFHQVYDTSSAARDLRGEYMNSRPDLMYTFINQKPYQHLGQNTKVLYRKNNIDFKIPRGLQGKSINGALSFNQRANETRMILKEHYTNHILQNSNLITSIMGPAGTNKANGFQQYIINNIKHENNNIQQAYSKFNNYQSVNFNQPKEYRQTIGSSFVNQKSREDIPKMSLNDSLDSSIGKIHFSQLNREFQGHQQSNPYLDKRNSIHASPPQVRNSKVTFRGNQQLTGTPLTGAKGITQSPKLDALSVKSASENKQSINQGFPQIKYPNGNYSSNAYRALQDPQQEQRFFTIQNSTNVQPHKTTRRDTMTELGAQIIVSGGHIKKLVGSNGNSTNFGSISQKLQTQRKGSSSINATSGGGLITDNSTAFPIHHNHSFSTAKKRESKRKVSQVAEMAGLSVISSGINLNLGHHRF